VVREEVSFWVRKEHSFFSSSNWISVLDKSRSRVLRVSSASSRLESESERVVCRRSLSKVKNFV
jgi:hypothetical protein